MVDQHVSIVPNGQMAGNLEDEEDNRALDAFCEALDAFVTVAKRETMPLQYLRTFLMIARDEGKSVGDYAERAGVSKSVMSRHILDIGDRDRAGEPGFELITNRRLGWKTHEIVLTPKGRGLRQRIARLIRLGRPR